MTPRRTFHLERPLPYGDDRAGGVFTFDLSDLYASEPEPLPLRLIAPSTITGAPMSTAPVAWAERIVRDLAPDEHYCLVHIPYVHLAWTSCRSNGTRPRRA
jgi:hypothetical protein